MSKRVRKTFINKKTGHETATSLPVEQNRLKAQGYVEKPVEKPEQKPVEAPKPVAPKK